MTIASSGQYVSSLLGGSGQRLEAGKPQEPGLKGALPRVMATGLGKVF